MASTGIETRRIPFRKRSGLQAWPNGARMAVLVYSSPEEWVWGEREPLPTPGTFTVPGEPKQSFSSRSAVQFGYNVGLYRQMEIFAKHDLKVTMWTNGTTVEQHRSVLEDIVAEGHILGAHGYSEGAVISTLPAEAQKDNIAKTVDLLAEVSGKEPKGWISPGAACTVETIELLSAAGFDYHCDLQDDELPYFMNVGGREMVQVPYRMVGNVNDFPIFTRNVLSVKAGVQHLKEAFDAYHGQAMKTPLLFNYGTHPFVSGRPDYATVLDEFIGYIKSHDDVWVCHYDELVAWWKGQFSDHPDLVTLNVSE